MFSPYHNSNQSLPTVRVDGQSSGKYAGTGFKPPNSKSRMGPNDGVPRRSPQFSYGPQEPLNYPASPYSVNHYPPMTNPWGIPSYTPPGGIPSTDGMGGGAGGMRSLHGDPPIGSSTNSGYNLDYAGTPGQSPVGTPRLPYPPISPINVPSHPQPPHPSAYGGFTSPLASPAHPSTLLSPRGFDPKPTSWGNNAFNGGGGHRSPTKKFAVDDKKFRKPLVCPAGIEYTTTPRGVPVIKPTPEGLKKAGPVTPPFWLNSEGFPLRPGKPDCKHYISKGWCAYQTLCKFNHPEPGHPRSPVAAYVPPPPAPAPQMLPAAWGGSPPAYYWGPWGPQVPPTFMVQPPVYPSVTPGMGMYYPGPASVDSGVSTLSGMPNMDSEGSDHGSFKRTPRGA